VIGLGNEFRQDDGVGLSVARRLASGVAGSIDVIEHDGDGVSLLDAWEGARVVVLVDAVRSGAAPGTIHCLDLHETALPDGAAWSSTHSLGLAEAVALARRLGRLPDALLVYGIEGRCFGPGRGLSPEVDGAAAAVVDMLLRRLGAGEGGNWPAAGDARRP
jgi:hydrogenase maturation protease